jgi:pectate lyase
MNAKYLIFVFFVLFLSMSVISANELNQNNATSLNDDSSMEIVNYHDETNLNNDYLQVYSQEVISNDNEFIVVNNWEELQYYCTQSDKNYNLKLKENTNFYPSTPTDVNSQIKIKNNVKIIGSEGSWFGDSSSDAVKLKFLPIVVENDERVGLTLENITFKWINAGGSTNLPDGMFIKIGGKKNTIIKNCIFQDIQTTVGHSCIVHLSKGTMTLDNCSFIRCNTNYGCLSVYGSSPHMTVQNCYFENNYAKTEPGCINNCGKLTVYNTTFYKNRAGSWAGAIHTHSGASS